MSSVTRKLAHDELVTVTVPAPRQRRPGDREPRKSFPHFRRIWWWSSR